MKRKIYIVLTSPLEVLGCAFVGAWFGARDGYRNIRDAWKRDARSTGQREP